MNITDIKLKYAPHTTPASSTVVKTANDMATLEANLAAGVGEATLTEAGPYYEVTIENNGSTYTVNVPAFTLGLGSTGLYNAGVNKVSAIAKELLAKHFETHPTTFDIVQYRADRRTQLTAEISAEEALANPDKKKLRKLRRDLKNVSKIEEKDIKDILEEQISVLENQINTGVNITSPITATRNMPQTLKNYFGLVKALEEKKVQKANAPKKNRLKVFSGMWNFAKIHKKGIASIALAGTLVGTGIAGIATKGFGLFDGDDKDKSTELPKQPAIITQVPNGVTVKSTEFASAVATNMIKYGAYKDTVELTSDLSFEQVVRGFTFIEQCDVMNTEALNSSEISSYICAGDCLITLLCRNNQYDCVSEEARQAINGGIETSTKFLEQNNATNGGTLIDYMVVGRSAGLKIKDAVANGQALSTDLENYNFRVYNPGLAVYETFLDNGLDIGANLNNQLTLGVHPAMNRA